jgi:hypothetical protein
MLPLRKPSTESVAADSSAIMNEILVRLGSLNTDQMVHILRALRREMSNAIHSAANGALPAETAPDGRHTKRKRTLKTGKIVYNNKMCVIDCQIRDMSESGCRVRITNTVGIPRRVELIVPMDSKQRECEVVWKTRSELGIRYLAQ